MAEKFRMRRFRSRNLAFSGCKRVPKTVPTGNSTFRLSFPFLEMVNSWTSLSQAS
jgi:hypothetical protein